MNKFTMSMGEIEDLTIKVLENHSVSSDNAGTVAEYLVLAEADGLSSHGLARIPAYASQAKSGKVDGFAQPDTLQTSSSAVLTDAKTGFAYPALEAGLEKLIEVTRKTGIAALAISNSHHCGVLGHAIEKIAKHEMVGLGVANSPAAIAPWGGKNIIFGTNPIAFGCPLGEDDPLIVDMSLSKVARGKIMVAAQKNEPIPDDWALDEGGDTTTDPQKAMIGSMLPIGGAKGANLALMVEILATCFTGANFGFEADSFFTAQGSPPRVGQFFLAIRTDAFMKNIFADRIKTLTTSILDQPGTRLAGRQRFISRKKAQEEGIGLTREFYNNLLALSDSAA